MKRSAVVLVVMALAVAGCYGRPDPGNQAAPGDCTPATILMVGDSLLEQAAQTIKDEFTAHGYPEVVVVAHGGANVHEYTSWAEVPDGFANPREELQLSLDIVHPDIVVAQWGMNRVDSMWEQGLGWLMPWVVAIDMLEVQQMVADAGAQLHWTTIPVRIATGTIWNSPELDDYVNGVVNDQLIRNFGVPARRLAGGGGTGGRRRLGRVPPVPRGRERAPGPCTRRRPPDPRW